MMEMDADEILFRRLEKQLGKTSKREIGVSQESVDDPAFDLPKRHATLGCTEDVIFNAWVTTPKRHLEATGANLLAKKRLDQVIIQKHLTSDRLEGSCPAADFLSNQLDLRRRERQKHNLNVLSRYATQLKDLAAKQQDAAQSIEADAQPIQREETDPATSTEFEGARSKVRALEAAVLQSRRRAGREQARLQHLRDVSATAADVSRTQQLDALEAIRSQLTSWLEESLATCGSEESTSLKSPAQVNAAEAADLQDVEASYERYLEARSKLIEALELFISPQTVSSTASTGFQAPIRERAQLQPPQENLIDSETLYTALQSSHTSNQHQAFLEDSLAAERDSTRSILQRLADESQLLLAYPILAQSAKFGKVVTALGKPEDAQTEEIAQHAQAWAFAADAAAVRTQTQVNKDLTLGHGAMKGVQQNLDDMSFLNDAAAQP